MSFLSRFTTPLRSRGVVSVSGNDRLRFLQGLITNDIESLSDNDAQSAAFLNKRGRVLFGVYIHHRPDELLIDLDKRHINALIRHLSLYKLRSKVEISDLSARYNVWSSNDEASGLKDLAGFSTDARHESLGIRGLLEGDDKHNVIQGSETDYDTLRILNGIPDGGDFDNTPLPLDLGLHLLNSISFTKGCYLGQELTARTNFTGVLRKRLTPILLSDEESSISASTATQHIVTDAKNGLESGSEILKGGKKTATVLSTSHNLGTAILRLDDVHNNTALTLADGRRIHAWAPMWWDSDAAKAEGSA